MDRLTELLDNQYPPIAIYHTTEVPDWCEKAAEVHCIINSFFIPAIKEGRSIYGGPEDIHCGGPISGFCIEDGGRRSMLEEAYSTKNGYFDSPQRVRDNYLKPLALPFTTKDYIVFEPLSKALDRGIEPEVVVFLADPLHISALTVLAGYARESTDAPVELRFALGCENLYLMPMIESRKEDPKCIVGFTDFYVRKIIDPDKFSFSIPYKLYTKMVSQAEDSFLSKGRWNLPYDDYKKSKHHSSKTDS
ncbi:MAG: DUF169 domain-containing protein [Candidatus Methanomethylophilus sp.]|nr:DUF169 domain-containing protein [Methanomethylophilus sp.]